MNTITSDDARKIFLSMLIARSYEGALKTVTALLEGDLPNKQLPSELAGAQRWFHSLDFESRQHVQRIVQKAIDSAVFGCLVLLDGLAGGNPIQGMPSDFALFLQTYEDDESRATNMSKYRLRVNSPELPEFLHDLYRDLVEERTD